MKTSTGADTTTGTGPVATEKPEFDAASHTYTSSGHNLPSVTTILSDVVPVTFHGATEWHMNRGTAIHACAAMLCEGVQFRHDPQIDGQVQAAKAWLAMRRPKVLAVERMVWKAGPGGYAGTLDLLCEMRGRLWIIDWKSSASPRDQWQIGGYAEALAEVTGLKARHGLIVELNENGQPREGEPIEIRRARNEWRSILNVYNMKQREGMK